MPPGGRPRKDPLQGLLPNAWLISAPLTTLGRRTHLALMRRDERPRSGSRLSVTRTIPVTYEARVGAGMRLGRTSRLWIKHASHIRHYCSQ